MHLSSLRSVVRSVRVARGAFALAGVLGMTLIATQVGAAPIASAAPGLRYQPGYSVQGSWLCYGWSGRAWNPYHCTQHWYRSGSQLVSTNPAWVPNIGSAPVARTAAAPVSHPAAPAPRHVSTAPRVSAPAAAPVSGGSVQSMIESTFGPYAGSALAVARCESGFNPNAKNPSSTASGVFQFLSSTWATTSYAGYSPFNAWANIQAAHQVFVRDGYSWHEWVCQP